MKYLLGFLVGIILLPLLIAWFLLIGPVMLITGIGMGVLGHEPDRL
jgi:hypothetical protein